MDRSKENFVSRENVEMLWELISDEDFMAIVSEDELPNFQVRFINDVKQFYQTEKGTDTNLMDMNKKFVDNVFGYWKQKMVPPSTIKQQQNYLPNTQKQNITDSMQQITAEDIQNSRMKEFEIQLAQKQNEFTNAMTHKIPEKPKFADDMDKPISEMEDLIAKTLAQRNFDISQIQMNIDKEKVDMAYFIRAGHKEGDLVTNTKTAIHSVFQHYEPHGDRYAYISEWLSNKMSDGKLPFVPHIVDLPEPSIPSITTLIFFIVQICIFKI
jgi:hypothetical protein